MSDNKGTHVKDINDAWHYLDSPYKLGDFTVTGQWFEGGYKQLLVREGGYSGEIIDGAQVFSENQTSTKR